MRRWVLASAGFIFAALSGFAAYQALDVTATPGTTGTYVIGGGTIGWSFTAQADLRVTDLGYYDLGGDGLQESHQVAIWTSEGVLVGSAVVQPGDTLIDGFRYTSTDPITLKAGESYVIGAYHNENVDNYLSSFGRGSLSSFSTAPGVLYEESRINFGDTFTMPELTGTIIGRFGPSFQFDLIDVVPVPEPSTALFGLALAGFCASARRRRRR